MVRANPNPKTLTLTLAGDTWARPCIVSWSERIGVTLTLVTLTTNLKLNANP